MEVCKGGKLDPCSKNTWALNMKSQVFLSPMYFPNVAEDLGKLGNDFTKRDHTIIVGGPGNSLDVPLLSSKGYQLHFRKVK